MIDISREVDLVYNNFESRVVLIKKEFSPSKPIGYCYKGSNYYNVYISDLNDDYYTDCIKMHEYGHIYFGHLTGIQEYMDDLLIDVMSDRFEELTDKINKTCNIDYGDELLERFIADPFYNHKIHNISMDLEINSKILDESDVRNLELHISSLYGDSNEGKNAKIKLMYPTDYGFPEKLTYQEYLYNVILNIDKFVEKILQIILSSSSDDGDEGNLSSGLPDGTIIKGNPPKTMKDFDELLKDLRDISDQDDNSEGNSEKEKEDIDHNSESRINQDKKRKDGKIISLGGNGASPKGSSTSTREVIVNNDPLDMALDKVIRNFRNKVIKREYRRHLTYKYNRGIDRSVISPRYRQLITKSEDPTIVYLIDVSGSMNTTLVDRCLRTISKNMKKISSGLTYNIITWDTDLCEHFREVSPRNPITRVSYGGGTRLVNAFDYFKQNYEDNAILIIISDFEDPSLEKWKDKEGSMSNYDMYGFNYGYSKIPDSFFKNIKIFNLGSS